MKPKKTDAHPALSLLLLLTFLVLNFTPIMVNAALAGGETELKQGIALYKAKRYKEAARVLEKALASGCGSADCYLYLAKSHYGSGNIEMAAKRFRDAEEAFKGLPASTYATKMLARIDPHNTTVKKKAATPAPVAKRAKTGPVYTGLAARISVTPPHFGHKPVSKETISAIAQAVNKLPPHLKKRLEDSGASISVSPNMIDKWPDSIRDLPENTPTLNLAEVPGRIYGKEMNIYERAKVRGSTSLKPARPPSMMRHTVLNESVQILDDLMNISKDPGLRKVYEQDKSRIPDSTRVKLATFLKDDDWGPRETCAELGAALLGGGDEFTADLYRYFPNTKAWLIKKLGI